MSVLCHVHSRPLLHPRRPTPDARRRHGGTIRFHDGNERPCEYGCVAMYTQAEQIIGQRTGKAPSDQEDIVKDCTACIRACIAAGADKVFWPPVEK